MVEEGQLLVKRPMQKVLGDVPKVQGTSSTHVTLPGCGQLVREATDTRSGEEAFLLELSGCGEMEALWRWNPILSEIDEVS